MSQTSDLDALAERYLDLWQDQITALAGNSDFVRAMQQVLGPLALTGLTAPPPWAAMMAAFAAARPDARPNDRGDDTSAPGAAAAAVSPDGGNGGLDELAQRLAALEERIAALEARGPGRRRGVARDARRRRS